MKTEEMNHLVSELKAWMPEGSTVYLILRSVSRSGMSRVISTVLIGDRLESGHDLTFPDYHIAQILGYSLDKNQGIKVQGCGMDMGFHLVSTLSRALYGHDHALKMRWL